MQIAKCLHEIVSINSKGKGDSLVLKNIFFELLTDDDPEIQWVILGNLEEYMKGFFRDDERDLTPKSQDSIDSDDEREQIKLDFYSECIDHLVSIVERINICFLSYLPINIYIFYTLLYVKVILNTFCFLKCIFYNSQQYSPEFKALNIFPTSYIISTFYSSKTLYNQCINLLNTHYHSFVKSELFVYLLNYFWTIVLAYSIIARTLSKII